MIPIGKELLQRGASLILAGTPTQLQILSEAFPECECLPLDGYQVKYGKYLPASWHVILQLPRLIKIIRQEQKWLSAIVPQLGITGIISDNRYGIYHQDCTNVMVMHQFVPPVTGIARLAKSFLWQAHKRFLKPFDQIWIPDTNDHHSLGHHMRPAQLPPHSYFLGWLSRLEGVMAPDSDLFSSQTAGPDLLVLLSGPEPQRSILEDNIRRQITSLGKTCWIVQGTPSSDPSPQKIPGGLLIPYMNANELTFWLPKAKVVLARSGYSSLMDFAVLGLKQVILVPTPGQPEQLLLGQSLHRNKMALSVSQQKLSIPKALTKVVAFRGFVKNENIKSQVSEVVGTMLT